MRIKADARGRIALAQAGISKPHQEWEVTEDERGVRLTPAQLVFPEIGEATDRNAVYVDYSRYGFRTRITVDLPGEDVGETAKKVEALRELFQSEEIHVRTVGVAAALFDILSRNLADGVTVYGYSR